MKIESKVKNRKLKYERRPFTIQFPHLIAETKWTVDKNQYQKTWENNSTIEIAVKFEILVQLYIAVDHFHNDVNSFELLLGT